MKKNNHDRYDKWHKMQQIDIYAKTPWHNFLKDYFSENKPYNKSILEIGCGRGGFAIWFFKNLGDIIKSYTACDYSEEALNTAKAYCREHGITKIIWKKDNIMDIQEHDNKYDIVISCETIEHVEKPQKAIKELYRILRNNGILILTTPNYQNFMGIYRIYLRLTGRQWTEVGQPINRFVMFDLTKKWLKKAGFKLEFSYSSTILYPSIFSKTTKLLNIKKPNFIVKRFGINSYFVASKHLK